MHPALLPRLCGFVGTFLGVGILHLKPSALSLPWQTVAAALVFAGSLGSIIVLAWLGKSFSIMPEARSLVTCGTLCHGRAIRFTRWNFSPLFGTAIQFTQPWAFLLALAVVVFQVLRTIFEERVLAEIYPEYARYRARVKRFGVL